MTDLIYLACASTFIVGLKRMNSPRTAQSGNVLAAGAMVVVIVLTLVVADIVTWGTIVAGLVAGTVLGALLAMRVEMTAMPQAVAILNGFGGLASALVALLAVIGTGATTVPVDTAVTGILSIVIGSLGFTGSLVAFAKLQEILPGRPILFGGQKIVNGLLLVLVVVISAWTVASSNLGGYWVLGGLALAIGVLSTIPIGGADMPVVIALLNSLTGLAAAMAGFVVSNNALIIGGALVGAAGMILTLQMCEAMNRSLANVLFAGFGAPAEVDTTTTGDRSVNRARAQDVAITLGYADSVMIVPGYGLAVAQAQHAARDLAEELESRGVSVRYAIHPVAGRMPGHMNVLLAEADVPYEQLLDLEQADPQMPQTSAALILGANDVVNPLARDEPNSPIYGMPILSADRAGSVVVVKRSLSPGFAGIDNPLFYNDNTLMYFADAKEGLEQVLVALRDV